MRRAIFVWPAISTQVPILRQQLAEHGISLEDVQPELTPDTVARIQDSQVDVVLLTDWAIAESGYGLREFVRDLLGAWQGAEDDRFIAVLSQKPAGDEIYSWLASRGVFNLASVAGKEELSIEDVVRLLSRRYRPTDPDVAALIDPAMAEQLRREAPKADGRKDADAAAAASHAPRQNSRLRMLRRGREGESAQRTLRPERPARQEGTEEQGQTGDAATEPVVHRAEGDQAHATASTGGGRATAGRPTIQRGSGRLYVVAGYKGGIGRTTAAASLAALLAGQGLRVAAGDLHWELPTLGAHFGVECVASGPGWEAICTGRLPDTLPNRWGVTVIPAPNGFTCRVEELQAGLRLLTQHFDAVILDLPPSPWDTAFRAAVAEADRVIVITTNDPVTVECNTKLIEIMARDLAVQLVRVVVVGMGWTEVTGGVPVDIVREALGAPATVWAGAVGFDAPAAIQALAGGMPLSLSRPALWEPIVNVLTGSAKVRTAARTAS